MSYVYSDVDKLEGTQKVGSKHCAVLVQYYAGAPVTPLWKEGEKVLGNTNIKKGTAIATFVNGKYPNLAKGNHAAFYISQDANTITVMDQWLSDSSKPKVCKRVMRKLGSVGGVYNDASNNAEAFSVID